MPVSVADGALGLEARHVWELLPSFPLNGPNFTIPVIRLDRIGGMYSLGEIEDLRASRTGAIGEIVYPSLMRGKTVTYEGRVIGTTLQTMRQWITLLRNAFTDTVNERRMTIHPDPLYGTGDFYFMARPMAFECDEEQIYAATRRPSGFQRNFILTLRMSDPRFYANGVDEWDTGSVMVFNKGSAPSDPTVIISGIDDPKDVWAQNLTTGGKLLFKELPSTEDVQIDFRKCSAWQGEQQITHLLRVAESNWWDYEQPGVAPGQNEITSCGDKTRVIFHHAFF